MIVEVGCRLVSCRCVELGDFCGGNVVTGLARGCRFISRFGVSHGFVAKKPWLTPKRLTLLFLI